MALNEKQNEENRQKWLLRARRERLDLSASVEEALENPIADDTEWPEEGEEQASLSRGTHSKRVFPPRLSLQSRPVPALRPDPVEADVDTYAVVSSEQDRSLTSPQNTGILRRFAQRLTSSFAALGMATQPEVIESSLQVSLDEVERSATSSSLSAAEPLAARTATPDEGREVRKRANPQPARPRGENDLTGKQGKQRLAGRTTRIHLETPPVRMAMKPQAGESTPVQRASSDWEQRDSMPIAAVPTVARKNTESGVDERRPVIDRRAEALARTGSSLPVVVQKTGEASTLERQASRREQTDGKESSSARRSLSGVGTFEVGQGEATVVNRQVTEASVVLVTLTGNPGPVVVQYVTLRPRIGFTVHLTAPATMRASFNYIVLLGELFHALA